MNYRHSFHAGNFADLVKHALVLRLLAERQARPRAAGAATVIDTHAGAGLYDLTGDAARSREAEAGVMRLMKATDRPPAIQALAEAVAALNAGEAAVRFYPGSPLLVARALRPGDRYVGFELNPPVHDLLVEALKAHDRARAVEGDGYALAEAEAREVRAPLVLIDPPFERADDYLRAAETGAVIARRDPAAVVAIWTPLKDMETFDGFVRRLEGAGVKRALMAEARLRPLNDPMRMNGCAMTVLNPPPGAEAAAREICGWVASELGEAGARAEIWSL